MPIAATLRLVQVPVSGGDQVFVPSGAKVPVGLTVRRQQAFLISCDAPALVSFATSTGTSNAKRVYASVQPGSWAIEVPADMMDITIDSTGQSVCSTWDPSTANQPKEGADVERVAKLLGELMRRIGMT